MGVEELVGKSSLGCEDIAEGLGSIHYVGLGRDGLLGIFRPGEWPSTWDRGPGKWPLIQDRPGWPQKLERVGRPLIRCPGDARCYCKRV